MNCFGDTVIMSSDKDTLEFKAVPTASRAVLWVGTRHLSFASTTSPAFDMAGFCTCEGS